MTLSQRERDADRGKWRHFTQAAIAAANDPASGVKVSALNLTLSMAKAFLLPTGERPEDLQCVALIHLAKAFTHQPSLPVRAALGIALGDLAASVGNMLDATDPAARQAASEPAQPLRRHRADIDD